MPILITCPTCGTKSRAPDHAAGRHCKCPDCGAAVSVPAVAGPKSTSPAGQPKAVDPQTGPVGEPKGQTSIQARMRRASWLLQSVRIRQAARKAFDLTHLGNGAAERLCSALILGAVFFFLVLVVGR